MFTSWNILKKGDIVDVVAPGWSCSKEDIKKVSQYIQNIGLAPRIPKDIFTDEAYLSNTDIYRFEHLRNALYAEDSSAVWCIQGGYGSARLIKRLSKLKQPLNTKLFIGFSDPTALHLFIQRQWRWSTLHAPVLCKLLQDKIDRQSEKLLHQVIFGRKKQLEYSIEPLNDKAKIHQEIRSYVTGGNLSIVQTSISTSWEILSRGKLVFLEEHDERGYSVDRMLQHLYQSGITRASALLIGDITKGDEKNGENHTDYAVQEFSWHLNIPVFRIQHIGHGKQNKPLPLGTKATIHVNDTVNLAVESGGV